MSQQMWRVRLLGGLSAEHADRVITRFQTRKTGLLLAYLAYHPHRSHPREELIELFWRDADPKAGCHSLRQALSSLRRQFEPPGGTLTSDRGTIGVNPLAVKTDVAEFLAAAHAADRAESPAARTRLLADAVALYQGPLLPSSGEAWVLGQRAWLEEQFFNVLHRLMEQLEESGDLERALHYARHGVRIDPLREEAHREMMRLQDVAGRPEAALRQYAELKRLLDRELDETPMAGTRALALEIASRRRTPMASLTYSSRRGDPFGGLSVTEAQRLRELQRENLRLKCQLAERELEVATLKEATRE